MDYRISARAQEFTAEVEEELKRALSAALTEAAEDAASEARRLVSEHSTDQGFLEGSIQTDTTDPQEKVVFSGNDRVPYDIFTEFGTAPHWPPIAPIEAWVRRNLAVKSVGAGAKRQRIYQIKAEPGKGFHPVRAKTSREQQEVRRVAFLVARKIAREGLDPKPFMRPAMNMVEREAPAIIERHMKEAGF